MLNMDFAITNRIHYCSFWSLFTLWLGSIYLSIYGIYIAPLQGNYSEVQSVVQPKLCKMVTIQFVTDAIRFALHTDLF